jgi:hypothetical protein
MPRISHGHVLAAIQTGIRQAAAAMLPTADCEPPTIILGARTGRSAPVNRSAASHPPRKIFGDLLGPPPGELAEPITLRDKLACVWKQLLAAPSQISVAVDLRSMTK